MFPRKSKGKHEPANSIEENNAHLSTPAQSAPIPASHSKTDSPQDHPLEREIDFAELEDGSLAEMIEDPADPAKPRLAVYSNGTVRYRDKLHDGNRVLVPLSRTDFLSKHVRLPQGAESYGGLRDLIGDVGSFFHFCLDVEPVSQILMTAHVFSSWFLEKLPFAPYLALVGPPSSGKSTALRILSLLCRRGLPTSDITSAAFYDVCHRMHPTILIDETRTAGHPRTLLHLLRSSSSRGFVALRKDKAQMAYGPKVLAWLELPDDAALNSRCVIIPMHKTTRADLKGPDDPNVLRFAAKVRMRLLQFRFEHFHTLSLPKIPANIQLSSRTLDLYRALALPFGADQELCEALAHLVAAQRQFQPGLLSTPQASAVRVLYELIHARPTDAGFRLKDLTLLMNSDLASRGEPSRLNERKTGDILTSLGLTNRSRTNPGNYVLWVDRSYRVRIHEKARNYEVEGIPTDPIQNCEICAKTSTASRTGRPLETVEEKQVRSDEPKRERRERREHHLGGGTRSTARSINRLRSRNRNRRPLSNAK
jgi:hypothetical protein